VQKNGQMAKEVATATPNFFKKKKLKIRGNMGSFGYNWSN
jgi:hypothetical protein